ncbi:succinylglutamate desuccinylase/aspartoacylase domain-containing protein [Paenibacillus thalictri]|nr:succinylglutamate desuccinylase/aspartoacylase family protein [Paenibacillus thalictri]
MDITPVKDIDWESPGNRLYHVPFTYDGEWARVRVPVSVICGHRPGKTLVAIGGTHGDEYEGPIGCKKLVAELEPERLSGRVIVIPVLNVPAFQADQRESPLDGGNMNRAFPGDANGTITSRIAHFVTHEVLSRADIVVDIHAAGTSMEIMRAASFHQIDDPELFRAHVETAFAFGMPFALVYTGGMGTGLLSEEAEKMGKITIGGEFGYGASADLEGVRWAYEGLKNVMKLHGLMPGELERLLPERFKRQVLAANTDIDRYITAPISGIAEPLAPIGAFVNKGDPVVCIHDFDDITNPGVIIQADRDGYVACRKFRARTRQGDVVMVIAEEIPNPLAEGEGLQ